jgi:hypothetical protein
MQQEMGKMGVNDSVTVLPPVLVVNGRDSKRQAPDTKKTAFVLPD